MAMLLFAPAAFAEAPLVHLEVEGASVRATRAQVAAEGVLPEFANGTSHLPESAREEIKYSLEYSTSKEGPWVTASSGSKTIKPYTGLEEFGVELHQLSPDTTYYLLAVVKNKEGEETTKEAEFTTTSIAAPELYCHVTEGEPACGGGGSPIHIGQKKLSGAYELTFATRLESNGAETEYDVEYGPSAVGPWTPIESGTITVAQDYLELERTITGLAPGKTYYVHITAKNAKGKIEEVEHFTTLPATVGNVGQLELKSVSASSAGFRTAFDPRSSESHWRVEYITVKALEEGGAWLDGPEGVVSAAEATENDANFEFELTGLAPSTAYDVRLFAENTHPPGVTGQLEGFETAGAPFAETLAVHSLDGEALRLLGWVVPRGLDSHYRFQYVTQKHYEAQGFADPGETSSLDAGGSGSETHFETRMVGADLPALIAGETYRYRIVASNSASGSLATVGGVRSLVAPGAGGIEEGAEGSQPVGACSNEALRTGPSSHLPDCRAYEQVTPVDKEGAKDIFRFGGNDESVILGGDGEHVIFSSAGVQWGSSPDPVDSTYLLSREEGSGWQTTSARPQAETGGVAYYEPALWSADLTSLAFDHVGWGTIETESKDVQLRVGPAGGPYETIATLPRSEVPGPNATIAAGSAQAGVYVISTSDRALAPSHASATTSGEDLYEYSHGRLSQVNVTGENMTIGRCGATIVGAPETSAWAQAVSADGSHIFFYAVPGANCSEPPHLWMRLDGDRTLDIGQYKFVAASKDGSELVLDRADGEQYEYVLYDTETSVAKTLFLTPGQLEEPTVSEDLSTVYFHSSARLVPEAPPALSSDSGQDSQDYYRYSISSGSLQFLFQAEIATEEAAQSSQEGRYLYFLPRDVGGVTPLSTSEEQAYRYDSSSGLLQCVSCASPFDPEPKLKSVFFPFHHSVRYGAWDLPASQNGDYVFFDTPSALVPQDVDGEVPTELERGSPKDGSEVSELYTTSSDVYEWRRDGIDGCGALQGCLALISSGTGGLENEFLGTDASGRDVFFTTHSQLAPSDTDAAGDIYDARIGGGFPASPPGATECEGDACASAVGPPLAVTPASFVFSGTGNTPPTQATPPTVKKGKPKTKKHKTKTKKKQKSSRQLHKARKSAERGRR